MKYLLLPQPFHDGEIHCLGINNNNTNLITGGIDNKINVWNLQQLLSISKLDSSVSKENQCQQIERFQPSHTISCHDTTVNILKWLPNSTTKFISGDINGNIHFHDLQESNHKHIFPFNEETTSKLSPLVDLTISRDGRLVSWSTNDEKIYVIDIERETFQELKPISNETPVIQRSLAFNNTTNYLVAVGDDTQINIFQYEYESSGGSYKFRCINKITRFFSKNPINVKYKRISWSPDGELLSVPTATKGQTTLFSLISSTSNWTSRESLVGHDLSCEVVKFSPLIYSNKENDEENLHNIIASSGSDKSFAVWNTSNASPLILLKDLVNNAQIYDLAWTDSDDIIFCTSAGNLGIVSFEDHELGYKVEDSVVNKLKKFTTEKMRSLDYRYEYDQLSGNRKIMAPLEFSDQNDAIKIEDDKEEDKSTEKEKETENDEVDQEDTTSKGPIEPKIIKPTQPRDDTHTEITKKQTPPIESRSSNTITTKPASKSTHEINLNKQKTTTKNGKRRIQPTLLTNNGSTSSSTNFLKTTPAESISVTGKTSMEFDKPSYSVSDEFNRSKRRREEDSNGVVKKPKREMEPVKFIGSVIINPNTSFAKARLATPKVRFGFQLKSQSNDDLFTLDIRNGSGNETKPSRVTYFKKDKEIWCDFVPKLIQLACEGSVFWAIATIDGQILTYSHLSGKRLLPPIILGSPISYLESHGKFLMAVTSLGELYVWNLENKKIEVNCSISGLLELGSKFQDDGLSKSDTITLCAITSLGIPLVTLSNGSGYLFNKDLGMWQTITESWWLFGSHYWDSADDGKKSIQSLNMFDDEESILELLENKTNEEILRKTRTGRGKFFNKISKNMLMKEGFESLENTISISHLENRILCCELLSENKDLYKYFKIYVQRICELGFKAKLYEICDELLGPIDNDDETNEWNPKICGLNKRDLLKEVITLCSQYRDAQRVLYHFGNKIGMINDEMDGVVSNSIN
ncbi:HIR2 [Candida jiufengensis]|uniref:HIR2 n=1 Tax=Candida jiufengensis TaxID=497108 RepID=UPI0022249083|nr:HIR2 [Candida jiufengensis]KAI5956494.1 HIR2 [Candida jiufengensis]